ncbi:hypothetical protein YASMINEVIRUS_510 [Yasminevirus sp. GU-2018]|uniref:Uncharacterized protein n=1 Tax=Yasminevirus sp. GU-2018 TaxID=2420051 RepID=A0A5K0U866_9VIRU|nr:hypothetical protein YASMINEVIRUS_510 [Yasminevirus sp. GU-2018]
MHDNTETKRTTMCSNNPNYRFVNDETAKKIDRKCEKSFAVIECLDVLTGVIHVTTPELVRSAYETVDTYERYLPKDIVQFKVRCIEETHEELVEAWREFGFIVIPEYRPHAINASLKSGMSETIIIHKLKDDSRDLPWALTFNHMSGEKDWVNDVFNSISDAMYKDIKDDPNRKNLFKVYGSMCHRGFVNSVFDYNHQSEMAKLRNYVGIIGNDREEVLENIKILSDIRSSFVSEYDKPSDLSIHKNGFYTSYVRMIAIYCEMMFGLSRYDIAKVFEKTDPKVFEEYVNETKNTDIAKYSMFKAGYVFGVGEPR